MTTYEKSGGLDVSRLISSSATSQYKSTLMGVLSRPAARAAKVQPAPYYVAVLFVLFANKLVPAACGPVESAKNCSDVDSAGEVEIESSATEIKAVRLILAVAFHA